MMQYLPYASKINSDGRPLYARNHGIQQDLVQGENTIEFPAVYKLAKITAVEVINCEALDFVDFKVADANGNVLNQFSFSLNMPNDYYHRASKFDADFLQGLKIVMVYNSVSAKRVGINFIMDEVK